MARILILDDDVLFREMLASTMVMEGHEAHGVATIADCKAALAQNVFDLVFLDVGLPDGDGLEMVSVIRQDLSAPEIIIITGDGDADGAETAITRGALDYISKPASLAAIKQAVRRALSYRASSTLLVEPERSGIVGSSSVMRRCFRVLAEAASSEAPVLITGETGTGKELFARAIHKNSARSCGPMVTVDCGAIAKTLTESELFGHERGAFTGADRPREGLVLQANGGTLFLDEVGELGLTQQRSFLRVLQERRFRPVGSEKEVSSNFRLVAATNKSLETLVAQGAFRKDLLYRLQALHVTLPPLRERLEDLRDLAEFFVAKGCARYAFAPKELNAAYVQELGAYTWPGNVRELLHVVEQSLIRGRFADELLPEHLPSSIRVAVARSRIGETLLAARSTRKGALAEDTADTPLAGGHAASTRGSTGNSSSNLRVEVDAGGGVPQRADGAKNDGIRFAVEGLPDAGLPPWKDFRETSLDKIERCYLEWLLRVAEGNVPRASLLAGISRQRLYAMLRKHGIVRNWQAEI